MSAAAIHEATVHAVHAEREAAELIRMLFELDDRLDELFFEHRADAAAAERETKRLEEEQLRVLQAQIWERITTPEMAARLARHLHELEDGEEQANVDAKVLKARAKRRRERGKRVIWPALVTYAERQRRPNKKTVRFLPRQSRITWLPTQLSAEVVDEQKALAYAREQMGIKKAIEAGVVRVKFEISRTGCCEHFAATGEEIPGVRIDPGGDEKPVLYRK